MKVKFQDIEFYIVTSDADLKIAKRRYMFSSIEEADSLLVKFETYLKVVGRKEDLRVCRITGHPSGGVRLAHIVKGQDGCWRGVDAITGLVTPPFVIASVLKNAIIARFIQLGIMKNAQWVLER